MFLNLVTNAKGRKKKTSAEGECFVYIMSIVQQKFSMAVIYDLCYYRGYIFRS